MDYTAGAANEIKSPQTAVKATANAKTYVKVATSMATSLRKGMAGPRSGRIGTRRSGEGFQIRGPWTGTERIEVLTPDGKLKAAFAPGAGEAWYSLPPQLGRGAYLIRIMEKNGASETSPVSLR
jgi:hypothetical protein